MRWGAVCKTARGAHFTLQNMFLLQSMPVVYFCHPVMTFWKQKQEESFVRTHCTFSAALQARLIAFLGFIWMELQWQQCFHYQKALHVCNVLGHKSSLLSHRAPWKNCAKVIQSSTQIPHKKVFNYYKNENAKIIKLLPVQFRRNQKLGSDVSEWTLRISSIYNWPMEEPRNWALNRCWRSSGLNQYSNLIALATLVTGCIK